LAPNPQRSLLATLFLGAIVFRVRDPRDDGAIDHANDRLSKCCMTKSIYYKVLDEDPYGL